MYATGVQSIALTRRRPVRVARSKDYAIGPVVVVAHECGALHTPAAAADGALRDSRARARA